MSLSDTLSSNKHQYFAGKGNKYLSTRLLTHNGVTIAFALGKTKEEVLNVAEEEANRPDPKAGQDGSPPLEKLDSQSWLENVRTLSFSSEVRVVGEEAVPVFQIPSIDRGRRSVAAEAKNRSLWLSTSLGLMDPNVVNFEVLSDGRYVYLFRQSRRENDPFPTEPGKSDSRSKAQKPPINANLLCDRYNLVGSILSRSLEVRYRRSRQKRLPLNEQDTLAVQDIDDAFFYEPTFSLRFIQDMTMGCFSVLQTPTMTNDIMRWMFFTVPSHSMQIECYTTDVAKDGLFDIHGQIYYTCDSEYHENSFSNAPGVCSLATEEGPCNLSKKAIVPQSALSDRAIFLYKKSAGVQLQLEDPIILTGPEFSEGFTLEAWIAPVSFWADKVDQPSEISSQTSLANGDTGPPAESTSYPPTGSSFCVFSMSSGESKNWPSVFLDDNLRLVLRASTEDSVALTHYSKLTVDDWNHVAVTFDAIYHTFALVVNGVPGETTYILPQTSQSKDVKLTGFASQSGKYGFQGQIDEIRLWNHALHAETIKSKMSIRATGLEPLLHSCWHCDEGTGAELFDATVNGHTITLTPENSSKAIPPGLWDKSTAPLTSNIGLSKRVLRFNSKEITLKGCIGAGMYFEQVSVSQTSSNGKGDGKDEKKDQKPLKRGARVLLAFSAQKSDTSSCLCTLDFGLLSDGTLCDSPATISLPSIALSDDKSLRPQLLFVDAQGMEIFGGLLHDHATYCAFEPPRVWDSAAGSVAIYFRHTLGNFAAVNYDISRSIKFTTVSGLADALAISVTNRLRQAVTIDLETKPWKYSPESVSLTLTITAKMVDNKVVVETWQGIPAHVDRFCDILNGVDTTPSRKIGTLVKFVKATGATMTSNNEKLQLFYLILDEPLTMTIPLSSCVTVGGQHLQVLEAADKHDTQILVSQPYASTPPLAKLPGKGLEVHVLGYDFKKLVTCTGKPAGSFAQGSSLLSLSKPAIDNVTAGSIMRINVGAKHQITAISQRPFFTSPARSTSLRLVNGSVYSMLEEARATTAASGITFESWIKPEQILDSVLVAYTSQKLQRSERTAPEQQTFILAIRAAPSTRPGFDLVCNTNGSTFSVNNPSALRTNTWMHFSCTSRIAFALQFDGTNYVDLGAAEEFNVSDFSLAFTLQVDQLKGEQILFSKSDSSSSVTPLHITITSSGALKLSYFAEKEKDSTVAQRQVTSSGCLTAGCPYKVFISRNLVRISRKGDVPRSVQIVKICAWQTNGVAVDIVQPNSMAELEASENGNGSNIGLDSDGVHQAAGLAQPNDFPFTLGGAQWASDKGLIGSIGSVRFYSAAINAPSYDKFCLQQDTERSRIGAWSCRQPGGKTLHDDTGRNNGKLKNDPDWILSKFEPDHQHSVFINGHAMETVHTTPETSLQSPAGEHQLTLGNVIHGDDVTRYLAMPNTFSGQFDELRIWNVPRTKENINDAMNSRLSEVPSDMAVYLPFDDPGVQGTNALKNVGFLADASINGWHLTPLHEAQPLKTISDAPVSTDSPCVRHFLSSSMSSSDSVIESGAKISSSPAIAEYGDMQISATGGMEGSYKRAYSYIEDNSSWTLITGFRIGTLITEWVSQIQTSPTLKGYIEGAPPIPAENYTNRDDRPSSAIRFSNAQKCTYTYSSRGEVGTDLDITTSRGIGGKWQVSAGMGVESEVTSGEIKGAVKTSVNVSGSLINNAVSTATTNSNLEMRVELTGGWNKVEDSKSEVYEPANTGLALVESEVTDLFALRLKVRGPVAPLVAYQVRLNPNIPKDRNLVSFPINRAYSKQGCLDGRYGLKADDDYASSTVAPTDASYFKPIEAYALKDRIRRQEEQFEGEYQRAMLYGMDLKGDWKLPSRKHRNICNSYVWTADGGTYQETISTMDVVQSEVGGSLNTKASIGASLDMEVSVGSVLATCNVDALISAHTNLTQTKEMSSETGFELVTELPPAIDLRAPDANGTLVKRPGAVDAYRWMSFWLEESVEATDAFFRQVVDPKWLEDGQDPNSRLLLELRNTINKETGNARTKAWRVLHRCTYVSRIPETIVAKPKMAPTPGLGDDKKKKSSLLDDVSCNWHILQNLEPLIRGAKTRMELASIAQPVIGKLYPTIRSQPRYNQQLLNLLGDYIGLA